MTNAILGLIVAALAIAGMSIGLILRNKPLQPSCGGIYLSKVILARFVAKSKTKSSRTLN